MKYKGRNDWIFGDMWGLVVDGVFHGIHIKWSKTGEETPLGHVTSKDLLHFTACDDILYPLPESEYPMDCLMKFTGCCMTAKNGLHYIYYTMRTSNADEKIALAVSKDMKTFELYDKNPVLEVDENIFFTTGPHVDCRDMLIVYHEKEDVYYGYFAAMADMGYGSPSGVIGVAKSSDLVTWRDQKIAYAAPFMGTVEVPDVFEIDGKWYLIMLTGNNYGAKGISEDEDVTYFTAYAVADSPEGPFVHTDDKIFIGGNSNSAGVCRTVIFDGKRYLHYVDRGREGQSISLPKEICVVDGKLRPCYAPITQKLRTGKMMRKFDESSFKKLSSSHAWMTASGEAKVCEGKLIFDSYRNSYQKYRIENEKYASIEMECILSADCTECGFMFEAYSEKETERPQETSFLSLNFDREKVIMYQNALMFDPCAKRSVTLEKNKEYHVRAIVMEGIFEIYIDDILVLQGAIETAEHIVPGIVVGNGNCEIKELKIYELEK